jgi:diguanylate cyclase (GGDEF)-like protein
MISPKGMAPTSLRRLVSAIGMALAVTTTISIPAGYLLVGFSHLTHDLEFKAELNAATVARYIYSHERMWQFQQVRLAELIELNRTPGEPVRHRIFDVGGRLVLEEGEVFAPPAVKRGTPIMVASRTVGRLEAETSIRPLLASTAMVAVFSLLLGFGIYAGMRVFPIRVLDRTLGNLARTNEQFDTALSNMAQGLCMFDADHRLVVVNQPFSTMFSVPMEKFTPGISVCEFLDLIVRERNLSPARAAKLHDDLKFRIENGTTQNYVVETTDGRKISVVHTPMSNGGWVTTYLDVTRRHQDQAKIAHMAHHDALTDLPNRLRFREQLQHDLDSIRDEASITVLCLDLDYFKSVNDTLGHPLGDRLLQAVARRLRDSISDSDMVARLGGDEFAIIQRRPKQQPEEATALASHLIGVVGDPYDIDGHQLVIGLSVGIAVGPPDGRDADQLLKNADMALYRAKEDGRGTYRFFEQEMDARAQTRRRLELDLRAAVLNEQFELHYQPILRIDSGQITTLEALVRWRHPERGMIAPGDFIPLAEATGLIVPIGEWVLRKACSDAAAWSRPVNVAVNLSPVQFKHRTLVQSVITAIAASGLPAERLELEITESVLLQDSEATLATLHTLRSFGVHISMDDFGTGYSSLSYLRSFPFDKIKIDQSFVRELSTRDDCVAIVRAVAGLGTSLGIATTAEGVETTEQLELLRLQGCGEVQGYLFSRPRPAAEVEAMLGQAQHVRNVA